MWRKQKKYCVSNHDVEVNYSKNQCRLIITWPLGSTEIDTMVDLLEENGYINKWYGADKKGEK